LELELDHIVFAAADLDKGNEYIGSLLGVTPVQGGTHQGLGTRNSLVSFGDGQYLEIIAPIEENVPPGSYGDKLQKIETPGLINWVLRSNNLTELVDATATTKIGLLPIGPVPTERKTLHGELLNWDLLFLGKHDYGSLLPFFIDWKDCPHPSQSSPSGGALNSLALYSPHAKTLNDTFAEIGISQTFIQSDITKIEAKIETARGEIMLESNTQSLSEWPF